MTTERLRQSDDNYCNFSVLRTLKERERDRETGREKERERNRDTQRERERSGQRETERERASEK